MSDIQSHSDAGKARHSIKTTPARPAPAYRVDELAEAGPIGRTSIFNAIKKGKLRAKKAGSATIILAADWQDFLESLPSAKAA